MEVAQMVHQNLILHYSPQSWGNLLTYGWRLPPHPHMWGCYCDDYMQLSVLDDEVEPQDLRAPAVELAARQAHRS
eukprot:3204785-Amphidinium_carterae.1